MSIGPERLFVYVDESGQDTFGELFVVGIVVTDRSRDILRDTCKEIETKTQKGRIKWAKSGVKYQLQYIRDVFVKAREYASFHVHVFRDTTEYHDCTTAAIGETLLSHYPNATKVTVLIDGLSKSRNTPYRLQLRDMGVPVHKVRGVRRESADSRIRLADALAGIGRMAVEQRSKYENHIRLYTDAESRGWIQHIDY